MTLFIEVSAPLVAPVSVRSVLLLTALRLRSASLAVCTMVWVAALVVWLFRTIFRKTQGSSESRVSTLVGMEATIISPIAANAVGEIAYVQSGTRYTAPARTEDGAALATGRSVKISRIVGAQFYVVPV